MRGGLTHRGSMAALACCALALLGPVGCGGGDASSPSTAAQARTRKTTTRPLSPAAQARAAARAQRRERTELERTFAPNPYPEPPEGRPHPHGHLDHLVVREIARGHGPALRGDDSVYVNYVKTFWRSGRKFLIAWGPRRFESLLMSGQSPGMRRGMIGMRPGGRRVILMPARMSDVHIPNAASGFTEARADVVLRKILR